MDILDKDVEALLVLETLRMQIISFLILFLFMYRRRVASRLGRKRKRPKKYTVLGRVPKQIEHMHDLVYDNEQDCIDNLRLGRNAFGRLCLVLEQSGGLRNMRGVSIPEQVAIFLSILAHHQKVRVVKKSFKRSPRTVSKYFNNVLNAVIRSYKLFVVTPQPIAADSTDERWKFFEGCLGALDRTYIPIRVPNKEHGKYRTRKGSCCVNVLGVCDINMNYIYVLTGWEGSAAVRRVLKDAVHRPNGLQVPKENYYLCDGGYTNDEGFLAPYRSTRYHLQEFGTGTGRPQNAKELFNLRHSKARNIIERSFGVLKIRWGVLRSNTWYPMQTQNKIVLACCLLHNFIRREMPIDPMEALLDTNGLLAEEPHEDYVDHVESSTEWTAWREALAQNMWNEYTGQA